MKNKLLTTLVAVLILLSAVNINYNYSNSKAVVGLKNDISQLSQQSPTYFVGQTGAQGIQGIGKDGAPGINAISFSTTIVKDVPLIGIQGIAGKDAPELQGRYNSTTGDYEQKYSTDTTWQIVIQCSKFVSSCPSDDTGIPANQNPNELGSN